MQFSGAAARIPSANDCDFGAGDLSFGRHHHPISTANLEAQKMFDQGLAQAFGSTTRRRFDRSSAQPTRSIRGDAALGQGVGARPKLHMDIDDARAKAAYDALTKARSLAFASSEHEKAYIDALAVRFGHRKADRAALARKFSQAMGALSSRYPTISMPL